MVETTWPAGLYYEQQGGTGQGIGCTVFTVGSARPCPCHHFASWVCTLPKLNVVPNPTLAGGWDLQEKHGQELINKEFLRILGNKISRHVSRLLFFGALVLGMDN